MSHDPEQIRTRNDPPEPPQVPGTSIDRKTQAILETAEMYESVDADRVDVDVNDGVVTLTGEVPNDSARQTMCNAVVNQAGVRDLHNRLVSSIG